MAIGGRNNVATIIVTVVVIGIVGALLWAAWPLLPMVGNWLSGIFFGFFDWLRATTA
ncbi:hypothetical protein [Microbacterium sp. ZXX196]|uniref:hypothetical protein n=1 Tax=Microbacterium sp. ZXX196 TaxID=2609291 RepID=UPI0012BA0DB9|nr:hypothetical protein [Microbacterium sp. ZXX196]MTE23551.1 hypothetical protein [Microbacterium sp. ZXX196]